MIYLPELSIAKNGSPTPLFSDGTAMHSSYNPEHEAATFGSELSADTGCIVVGGVGGGFHLSSLHGKLPNALIIAYEADGDSLSFCKEIPRVAQLAKDNVILCTIDSLKETILSNYLPALHNAFAFTVQRSWAEKNKAIALKGRTISDEALKIISADYSVQSHFGRIWQRNILLNLSFLSDICSAQDSPSYDTDKEAAVIAAGPSLDNTISILQEKRDDYIIFSTDTAYGSLLSHHIIPDIVVSIDGQLVSETHFYCCDRAEPSKNKTSFFFDLCASPAAARFVHGKGHPVFFLQSGHPLSSLACPGGSVPCINTGSGTVTIAAADLARLIGFHTIRIFGADFCYSSGKPYAKGTYLDANFGMGSSRTTTSELSFSALQFRTPLCRQTEQTLFSGKLKYPFTTEVLKSYENTLLTWIDSVNGRHSGSTLFLPIVSENKRWKFKPFSFSAAQFYASWCGHLKHFFDCGTSSVQKDRYSLSLFPYISFLKCHSSPANNQSFFELMKLAYSDAVRYTTKL